MILLALLAASDPTQWTGQRVLDQSLSAPEGGLPEEDLEPLLNVQQDDFYNPQDIRQDIATLYRLGAFSRVEVDVEEGAQPGPAGEDTKGVFVIYRVYPSPTLERLELEGNRRFRDAAIRRIIDKDIGDTFFPDEAFAARAAVEQAYHEAGWKEAEVEIFLENTDNRNIRLSLQITEGKPQTLTEIRVDRRIQEDKKGVRKGVLTPLKISLELLRHKLLQGRPYQDQSLHALEEALKEELTQKGYFEANVTVSISRENNQDVLVVVIDPRRHYQIKSDIKGLSRSQIQSELRLSEGALLSRYMEQEAGRVLTQYLQNQGFVEATVTVSVERTESEVILNITGERGPLYRLGKTTLLGDSSHTNRFLRGALQQASPKILGQNRVTRPAVEEAIGVLKEFYRSQGYLDASASIEEFDVKSVDFLFIHRRKVNLTIGAALGPQAILLPMSISGAELSEETLGTKKLFDELEGKPFSPAEIENLCRAIALLHQEAGYYYADASAVVVISPDGTEARVHIEVVAGPKVYLRSILIQGYSRTQRRRIEREIMLHPGDPLAPSKLTLIRRRLYNLETFSRVVVEPVGDEDRIKDLLIIVEERPNLYFELGGGAATDAGVQFFGRAGHRNLFGAGHRLSLLGQVGVGWVGTGWALNVLEPEWRAGASYEAPDTPTPGEKLSIDLLFNAEDQERYFRIGRSGFSTGLVLSMGDRATLELAWKIQLRRLLDVEPSLILDSDPWAALLSLGSSEDGVASFLGDNLRPQSGLRLSLLVDRRDDPFNPRKGVAFSSEIEISDGLGGFLVPAAPEEASWVRLESAMVLHIPVRRLAFQLRLRGGSGFVGGEGTLPLEDRFRLGGSSTMRGFDIDSLGPAEEASGTEVALPSLLEPIVDYAGRDETRWVATGGDTMGLLSVEMKIPLDTMGLSGWSDWQFAVFADMGNVWFLKEGITTESMETQDDPLLRYSVGVGLRRATVVGPIQLDLGFNPSPLSYRGEVPAISWVPIPFQLYLSLGAI